MMKNYIFVLTIAAWLVSGCGGPKIVMPQMDLPTPPKKPAIQSTVIVQNNTPWIGYSISDSLKLYEFLLSKDSYEEKLIFRLNSMNQIMQGK